ncbi:MAG: alpha/beta fold hydrolase [Nitrospirota bacterium]
MTRYDSIINGRNVRYYEGGEGTPLLLIHGAGATAKLWHRQSGPLSERFRVIVPDLPGFGGSERVPEIRSVRDYARFLFQFLSFLKITRVSVLGSSMGGWAAVWLAVDYPRTVDKLVLVSSAGVYRPDAAPMPVDEVLREIEKYYEATSGGTLSGAASDELSKAVDTLKGIGGSGGFVPDIELELPRVKAPTLVIWGSEDRVIPPSYADIFAQAIPDARVRLMEGAGHLPYVERAEEFNGMVLEFLLPDVIK